MGRPGPAPEGYEHPATPRVVDFANAKKAEIYLNEEGQKRSRLVDDRPTMGAGQGMGRGSLNSAGMLATPGQIRARARRRLARAQRLTDEAFEIQMIKPIDEWDAQELAMGRPRNADGDFRGRPSKYVTREIHERAMERFKTLIRDEMNVHSLTALKTIQMVLESEETDGRGKPVVPASTKLDAAKFLLEHIVGKPVQPTTTDISVKLQGILGTVMVNPAELAQQGRGYVMAHQGSRGELEGEIYDAEEVEEDGE